jgi:hypothetical protein
VKSFTARAAARPDASVVRQQGRAKESMMSTFENVAFGLMMGGWVLAHGLYVLQTLGLA